MPAKELDLLYRRGLSAMQERRSDEALRLWEVVWAADPRYGRVAEYLKRECLTRGMEAFAAGRLDEAAGFWRRALRVDPNDQRAIAYLQRAQQQLSRTREILGTTNN
jgi:tetratricopeptide (TPR) repeat protein